MEKYMQENNENITSFYIGNKQEELRLFQYNS